MEPNNTRRNLLEAANRVVARAGAARLTLDAVAQEAGMSKGTVLYHFHSKNELIGAMIDLLAGNFEQEFQKQIQANPEDKTPGHHLRAMLRAQVPPPGENADDPSSGLLAAVGNDGSLLDGLRIRYQVWQQQIAGDGLDPVQATVLRLASDGLWVCELFGFAPPTGEFREQVLRKMLELAAAPSEKDENKKEIKA